jgi:hypothetical protein
MAYPHQAISADSDIRFVVKRKKIISKQGKYNNIINIFFDKNLFFVKIKKKCSKKVTVRQAPIKLKLFQYKPVSDVLDVKVRKSPMAQVANENAKRL